jgi:hypothetical protein
MKLKQGLKVTIGHKIWVDEIPDDKFAGITADWPKSKVEEFRKRHEHLDASVASVTVEGE